jgi:hypothetical protein
LGSLPDRLRAQQPHARETPKIRHFPNKLGGRRKATLNRSAVAALFLPRGLGDVETGRLPMGGKPIVSTL